MDEYSYENMAKKFAMLADVTNETGKPIWTAVQKKDTVEKMTQAMKDWAGAPGILYAERINDIATDIVTVEKMKKKVKFGELGMRKLDI